MNNQMDNRKEISDQMGQRKKLTKWAKEPTVMDLKFDLDQAKPAHDAQTQRIRKWKNLRNIEGAAKPKTVKNRSNVQPKLVRRQAEWRYSALSEPFLSSQKMFKIEPVTFEDGEAAKQNDLLLNWQFRTKLNTVKFIDDYVHTGVDEGSIIVRVGWDRITEPETEEVPIFDFLRLQDEQQIQEFQQYVEMSEANPREFEENSEEIKAAVEIFKETGIPVFAVNSGKTETVEKERIIKNQPTLTIMDPENTYIDPSCEGDIEKAGYVIISFETSKAELLKSGRYKNLDQVNWSGNTILAQPDHITKTPNDFQYKDDLRKRVVAYEYWGFYDVDGKESLKPIVATWIGDVMIRMEDSPFPDEKPPFITVPYLPVSKSVFGEPDAEILEDNQAILGAVTRGMIDLMGRSANSQQGMAKGFLDVVNKRRFDKGQDYEFNPGQGDPRNSVYQHQFPEIPNSAITMLNLQNSEAEAISGVKAFSGGLSGEAYGDVAAGIKGMLDASSKREMNILRRLAKGIQDIGTKIMMMNQVFLSDEEVIRVTNSKFVKIKREDLKGNFDLKVDISTAEVDEAKSQDLGFMLQTLGPDMDPEMRYMILAEIAELKRMPELAEKLINYEPPQDPLMDELKQIEVEKAKKELEELESEIAYNYARAAKLKAEAEMIDLNYVEQETGTKHERERDRIKAQAVGNRDAEVTKALLKSRKEGETAPNIEEALLFNDLVDPNTGPRGTIG